jgi:hypothetical protein
MVIADVPTPIVAICLFSDDPEKYLGIILPSYNDSNNRGFSLQNGGIILL